MKKKAKLCSSSSLAPWLPLLLLGCTGELAQPPEGSAAGGSGPGGVGAGAAAGVSSGATAGTSGTSEVPAYAPPAGMMRRLTRAQFQNAVHDLLGVKVEVSELEADSWNGNFATIGAATVVTSEAGVERYHAAIESAVASVFADAERRAALLGCAPSGAAGDACLRGFLEGTGKRAWRRPLTAAEVERLLGVATKASSALGSAVEGARWATVALLQSPSFLYRPELGVAGADGKLRFSGYELASRLAFLVHNSLPDAELLSAAEAGALNSAEGLRAAAGRLLKAPAGRQAVGAFAEEFMRLDRVLAQAKDAALFPEYGASLQAAMVRDMRGTWETLAFDDRASALELFSTNKVVVNAGLAKVYGLDASGLDATTFKVMELPPGQPRAGILGKSAFLSQFANQKEGSPTLRGKFIRDALMCKSIPPPPGNVNAMLEEPPADAKLTKRQRLEMHRTNPSCAGCHALMDPLGLPLESFDAIGRFRTTDRGLTIDTSGELDGEPVRDAYDLGVAMGASADVANCLVRRYYSYAVGHEERDVDASVVSALEASFRASGYQLRDLVLNVVSHEAFSSVAPQP